jgi:hypothetical protein
LLSKILKMFSTVSHTGSSKTNASIPHPYALLVMGTDGKRTFLVVQIPRLRRSPFANVWINTK